MTTTVSPCRWYVVRTKAKQETRAESNLRRWGIETLAPAVREPRVRDSPRQRPCQIGPLFPGYIFARFEATRLEKVRLTRGVLHVVGFGEHATPVDDAIIEIIRSRIKADGLIHVEDPQPGDMVRIIDGPLRSIVGIFEKELTGKDRALVLLTLLGVHTRVQVTASYVQKVTRTVA
jgi:transcriptional antiterminator RfaH